MKVATLALAASAGLAAVSGQDASGGLPPPSGPGLTLLDTISLGLNFECLEAQFFSWAAFGQGAPEELLGGGPAASGGQKAKLTGSTAALATELATDDLKHLGAFRVNLGPASEALPCPAIDIGEAFADFMDAAAGMKLEPRFNPYENDIFFLHAAFILKDIGVQLYTGVTGNIFNGGDPTTALNTGLLTGAAGYQAGWVRAKLYEAIARGHTTRYGPVKDLVAAITKYRTTLAGATEEASGVISNNIFAIKETPMVLASGATKVMPTHPLSGVAVPRSPNSILAMVTMGQDSPTGGFYPNGLVGFYGPEGGNFAPVPAEPTEPAEPAEPTEPAKTCAKKFAKCGGDKNYDGPTCCEGNNTCVRKNAFYASCRPPAERVEVSEDVVPFYKRCSMKEGAKPCQMGSSCAEKRPGFMACLPDH